MGLGERETTLDLLEEAYDERSFYMPFIRYEPHFDSLRSEERFREIVRRMGFPPGPSAGNRELSASSRLGLPRRGASRFSEDL